MRPLIPLALGLAATTLSACGRCGDYKALAGDSDTLFIGDSILAWYDWSCQSVPHAASYELGRRLETEAVSGQPLTLSADSPADSDIVSQFEARSGEDWAWVVVDGGGNDINQECGCQDGQPGDCDVVVDGLIAEDASRGEVPELVQAIEAASAGTQVLLLGYYPVHPDASDGWQACAPSYSSLSERYAALAELDPRVDFFDMGTVVDPDRSPELYGIDRVHPNKDGTAALGRAIAAYLDGAGESEAP